MTTPFTPEPLDRVERRHVEAMLRWTNGNKRKAAALLGIARSTLIAKLAQYRVEDAGAEAFWVEGPGA